MPKEKKHHPVLLCFTHMEGKVYLSSATITAFTGLSVDDIDAHLMAATAAAGRVGNLYVDVDKRGHRLLTADLLRALATHVRGEGLTPTADWLDEALRDMLSQQTVGANIILSGFLKCARESRERESSGLTPKRDVYFFQDVDSQRVKIGVSWNVKQRVRGIATQAGREVVALGYIPGGGDAMETELHAKFAHIRLIGEWFRPGDDLMAYIREHAKPLPDDAKPKRGRRAKPAPERIADGLYRADGAAAAE